MAEAIDYARQPQNERQEFYHDSHDTHGERAESTLDADAILQLLRDKGVLEVMKDALGLAEKMMGAITETLEREEVVRTARNVTILIKTLGSIDPDTLENMMKSLSRATEGSTARKAPGFLHLLGQLASGDTRRALEPIAAALQAMGRSIPKSKEDECNTNRQSA